MTSQSCKLQLNRDMHHKPRGIFALFWDGLFFFFLVGLESLDVLSSPIYPLFHHSSPILYSPDFVETVHEANSG